MRTNIVIDDTLMRQALKTTGLKSKKDVVEEALKILLKVKNQEQLKTLQGKLTWTGDIDKMRSDK